MREKSLCIPAEDIDIRRITPTNFIANAGQGGHDFPGFLQTAGF
jgi:hypothetical protein